MIEEFVNHLTREAIERDVVKKEKISTVRYGLQMMVEVTLIVLSMLAIAVFMGQIGEAAAWMGTVIVIRSLEGGNHAKTFQRCYLITVGTFAGSTAAVIGISISQRVQISCWVGFMFSLLLYLLALRRKTSKSKLRKIGLMITAGYLLTVLVLLCFQISDSNMLASLIGMFAARASSLSRRREHHP